MVQIPFYKEADFGVIILACHGFSPRHYVNIHWGIYTDTVGKLNFRWFIPVIVVNFVIKPLRQVCFGISAVFFATNMVEY